jgi:hypothetical protein
MSGGVEGACHGENQEGDVLQERLQRARDVTPPHELSAPPAADARSEGCPSSTLVMLVVKVHRVAADEDADVAREVSTFTVL